MAVRFTPLQRFTTRRRRGLPRSWGTLCAYALLYDPRGTDRVRPRRRVDAAPACTTTKAPALSAFEAPSHGLGTPGLRFAARVAPTQRKTRFRLPAKLYRTGLLTRRVPSKGFRKCLSHLILFSQASWPKVHPISSGAIE